MPTRKGAKLSEETRRKMSESRKAFLENNELSEDQRKKMSEGMKAFWDNIKKLQEDNKENK